LVISEVQLLPRKAASTRYHQSSGSKSRRRSTAKDRPDFETPEGEDVGAVDVDLGDLKLAACG